MKVPMFTYNKYTGKTYFHGCYDWMENEDGQDGQEVDKITERQDERAKTTVREEER